MLVTHDVFTGLGLLAGLALYYGELRRRGMLDARIVAISVAAIVGGGLGARLITAWEHLPYYEALGEAPLSYVIEHSGKSIIGGLAGGYLAIVLAKRALGYRRSTGDSYALAIPVGTAIGRVGCFLSELPLGTPTDLPWGVSVSSQAAAGFPVCPGCDGPMHPSMVYEILFNLMAVALIVRFRHRVVVQGDLVKLYLLAAGSFRFLVEFVRGNPIQAFGLSGPQLVLIPLLALLAVHFLRNWQRGVNRVPPAPWRQRPILESRAG
ncbi:MAG: prolipoprotein diacylglyceryl transferase [Chloroflexi bacterium]|nr:prolipoprotein diacylglyceryl transferase [Chloroflexota bacterium]